MQQFFLTTVLQKSRTVVFLFAILSFFWSELSLFNDAKDSVKACGIGYAVSIMEKKQRVMVCGNNVILAGIKTSIGLDPNCELVGHDMTSGQDEIYSLRPDVIIFDLNAVQPNFRYSLAQELPGLLLIGIDPETNRALVWSGWEAKALSSQELAQVIHQTSISIQKTGRKE